MTDNSLLREINEVLKTTIEKNKIAKERSFIKHLCKLKTHYVEIKIDPVTDKIVYMLCASRRKIFPNLQLAKTPFKSDIPTNLLLSCLSTGVRINGYVSPLIRSDILFLKKRV
jgi:hypothetical protein